MVEKEKSKTVWKLKNIHLFPIKINLIFLILLTLTSCDSRYHKRIKPAYELKLKDTNPHPVFEGEVEPDIPDEELNDKTILGIDKNKNGIRDDIDIWINRTAKKHNEILALRQAARGIQGYLKIVSENKPYKAGEAMSESLRGILCLNVIFTDLKDQKKRLRVEFELKRLTFHPDERYLAASSFFKYIGGYGPSVKESHLACTFEIQNKEEVVKNFNTPGYNDED